MPERTCPLWRNACHKETCEFYVTLTVAVAGSKEPQSVAGCVFTLGMEALMNIANNASQISANTAIQKLIVPGMIRRGG